MTGRFVSLFAALWVAGSAWAASAPVKYTLDPSSSLLRFTFEQAGANIVGLDDELLISRFEMYFERRRGLDAAGVE